jgi:hypothetical protein
LGLLAFASVVENYALPGSDSLRDREQQVAALLDVH